MPEFSANHEHSNLHPTPGKGVEAIKRPDNSDTFEPSAHNNQQSNKLLSSGSYGSKEDSRNEEPRSNTEKTHSAYWGFDNKTYRSNKAFAKAWAQIFIPWEDGR